MEDLLQAVRHLYGAIERFDMAATNKLGIDRSGFRAINAMERGAVSPSALSAQLGLTSGAVTALLDRLEAAGHVQRSQVATDARRRNANLSRATRKSANAIYSELGKSLEGKLATLLDVEQQILLQGLLSLAIAFDEASENA